MNIRKRHSEESLLPIRANKKFKSSDGHAMLTPSIGSRWIDMGTSLVTGVKSFVNLVGDTGAQIFYGSPQIQDVSSPEPNPPSPTPSLPPSPPKAIPKAAEVREQPEPGPSRPRLAMPPPPAPPPPRPRSSQGKHQQRRVPSDKSWTTTVPSQTGLLSPPLTNSSPNSSPPSTTGTALPPAIASFVDAARQGREVQVTDELIEATEALRMQRAQDAVRRKHPRERPHIFAERHRRQVQLEQARIRENMEQTLFVIAQNEGYSSNYDEFKGLLGYSAQLDRLQKLEKTEAILSPSRSYTELRKAQAEHERDRRHSDPDQMYLGFLKRAIERAKATREGPKPPKAPHLDALREANILRSKAIDDRLRPARPSIPSKLPPEDEAQVDKLMKQRGVISKTGREQVSDKDISRLRPGQWLNDEIINFYGQLILSRSEGSKENPVANGTVGGKKPLNAYYFNTFFWTKMKDVGYEKGRLAKWTKKIDIFSKDVILIPINHNSAHWTCAAINFRKKRVESYDSMGVPRHSDVFKVLRSYIDAEHRNKKKIPFDFTGWEDYTFEDTPQQENGYDCGVFTCQFLESLSRGEETFYFSQSNMPYYRRRMVWEIGNAKLRDDL